MKQRKHAFLAVIIVLYVLFIHNTPVFCQMGINTSSPKTTLDVTVGTALTDIAGIQAPRLTLAQLAAKGNSLYGADQKGAILYITNVAGGGNTGQRANIATPGYYYFDGSFWLKFGFYTPSRAFGSIKGSFKTSDHNGWYLLDGRAVSGFPANIRTILASLGFSSNLPDARDRVLKTKTGSEILGAAGGANSLVLTRANLPNINLSATFGVTSSSAGAHTHSFNDTSTGAGAHAHDFSDVSTSAGAHSHIVSTPLRQNNSHLGSDPGRYNMTGAQAGTTITAGDHKHTVTGTAATGGAAHAHTVTGTVATGGAAHAHTFTGTSTVPLGGSGTALNKRPAYLVVNTFIYLGL